MVDQTLDYSVLDDQLEPLSDARHWYVGFSGGIDSTVLLHLLLRWRRHREAGPLLQAIHINHGLQAQADEWQVHCEWVCRLLQIPLVCLRADIDKGSLGPEAAARDARYNLFEQQLQADDILFLGHHADDQVETFFLRLLRGAGLQGLSGMPAIRSLGRGRLARPLLQLPRSELEAYADALGLKCVEDPSNRNTSLDRNFLRAEVLPLLAGRWPGYRATVGRASGHLEAAAGLLAREVPVVDTVHSVMGDPGIALAELDLQSSQETAMALRDWLRAAGLPAPDQAALAEFQRQLQSSSEQSRPRLQCSAFTLQRFRDAIYLLPEFAATAPGESLPLTPGDVVEMPAAAGRFWLEPGAVEGIRLAPEERLRVDWRRGGERCRPRGRSGRTGLKKLLQERNIPPWWRDWVPLLYIGDELLAVGDLWLCNSSRWDTAPGPGELLWQPRWERNISAAFD